MDLFDVVVAKKLSGGGDNVYTKITKTGTLASIIKNVSGNARNIAPMLQNGTLFLRITATLGADTVTFNCVSLDGLTIDAVLFFGSYGSTVTDFRTYFAHWTDVAGDEGALYTFALMEGASDNTWSETNYKPMASAVNCIAELVYLGNID